MRLTKFGDEPEKLLALYRNGLPPGSSTGWPDVDRHYTVGASQWTVITGIPSHGKSAWLDALMVNLMRRTLGEKVWKFLICSPENWPLEKHKANILECMVGHRFGVGPSQRMTEDDVVGAQRDLADRAWFVTLDEDETFPNLLAVSRKFAAEHQNAQVGIVLDPWNQLEHQRPPRLSETEYISEALSAIIRVTRGTGAHVWVVAHPAKLQRDRDTGTRPVPTPYDISGSANFFNKADNCVTIWRNPLAEPGEKDYGITQVHIQKVRFKNIGYPGIVDLLYDVPTGRYRSVLSQVDAARYAMASAGTTRMPGSDEGES
jgi:twinkle protein